MANAQYFFEDNVVELMPNFTWKICSLRTSTRCVKFYQAFNILKDC